MALMVWCEWVGGWMNGIYYLQMGISSSNGLCVRSFCSFLCWLLIQGPEWMDGSHLLEEWVGMDGTRLPSYVVFAKRSSEIPKNKNKNLTWKVIWVCGVVLRSKSLCLMSLFSSFSFALWWMYYYCIVPDMCKSHQNAR